MCPWAGGNFSRSDGSKTGSTVWQQEAAASVGIIASGHDIHDQDMASGINACLCKDGSNSPTANLPMAGFQHTNVGAATTNGQYVEYAQWQANVFPSGTTMQFFQAAAPTGWTQNTTYNDCLPRIVSGTGGGSYTAGQSFSSAVAGGSVGNHSITQAELPNCNLPVTDPGHGHSYTRPNFVGTGGGGGSVSIFYGASDTTGSNTTGITVSSGGSGTAHGHSFAGSALGINYVNVILASKN